MTSPLLLIVGCVLVSASSLTYVIVRLYQSKQESGAQDAVDPLGVFRPIVRLLAVVNERTPSWFLAHYRQRLQFAGVQRWLQPAEFLALQELVILGGVLALLAVGLVQVPVLLLTLPLGILIPEAWLRSRVEARRRQILRQFPTFLDFLLLALHCGRGLPEAMALASRELGKGPVADEFGIVLAETATAHSRAKALRHLADRVRMPAVTAFVAVVLQCDKVGADMREPLSAQAEMLRTQRFQLAEKLAGQAPIKMLAPLVLLILPCMMAVTLAPIIIELVHSLTHWR